MTPNETTEFLGFARVFSGTISKGQHINVLHPRYDPTNPVEDSQSRVSVIEVQELYLLMGREVVEVASVAAGSVFGIGGLEDHVLKCATLSTTLSCPALRSTHFAASPIVHVAIEPYHLADMPKLIRGMKLLNQADPCVEVTVQESGQHILSTAGEVHLQRCLDDLRDRFARVLLNVSEPIVPFRETIIPRPKVDMVNEAITSDNEIKRITANPLLRDEGNEDNDGIITMKTANKLCTLKIQATPLPSIVVDFLLKNSHLLKTLVFAKSSKLDSDERVKILELKDSFDELLDSAKGDWKGVVDNIMAFGPRGVGPNVLVNKVNGYSRPSVWSALDVSPRVGVALREYDNSLVNGFQLATLAGPLCDEPIHGVCYQITEWSIDEEGESMEGTTETTKSDVFGPFSGQLISAMKEGCRRAFLLQPARLMAAMYSCGILVSCIQYVCVCVFICI